MSDKKSVLDNKYVKGAMVAGSIFGFVGLIVTVAKSKPVAAMYAGLKSKVQSK